MREAAEASAGRRRALGKRIAQARRDMRWKQKQLAAAVHVEPTTVSRWENGRHAPDIDMLELIAEATDRPLSFFVDEVMTAAPGQNGAGDFRELREELQRQHQEVMERLDDLVQRQIDLAAKVTEQA